jgi:2-hydroxychromene-2-carboxylate isomerase
MRQADWYFDFISPYSYFAYKRLDEIRAHAAIDLRPILFAGLLKHWEHKGPAEIPAKRVWTYRSCVWWAERQGLAFRFPAAHPFSSLPYLRLAIAAGGGPAAVGAIFERLWTTGCDPADPAVLADLARSLDVDPARREAAEVKDALRRQTESAIARGVFGVPTLVIDGQVFWGNDAIDFAARYLADPSILEGPEMQRVSALPVGVSRLPA